MPGEPIKTEILFEEALRMPAQTFVLMKDDPAALLSEPFGFTQWEMSIALPKSIPLERAVLSCPIVCFSTEGNPCMAHRTIFWGKTILATDASICEFPMRNGCAMISRPSARR